ncbi:type I-B CRISPR-associated protein Cas8b/Csh1 [Halanaerobaculum tunisiense]
MIDAFKELGKKELKGLSESEKKRKFLETQTIEPNKPDSDDEDREKYREVIINLDTEQEEIEVKQGKELLEDNREEFFGFELSGNSSKTFFTSNKWYYHLLTIPHLIYYIQKEDYFNNSDYSEFLSYLKKLREIFYIVEGTDYFNRPVSYLKVNKFKEKQREKLKQYLEKKKDINGENLFEVINHNDLKKTLLKLISNFLDSTQKFVKQSKYYLNIFSLKIDDKYIIETNYKNEYLDVVHYILQQRFFDKSEDMVNEESLCGACNQSKLVTGKIDIPTKFYVTSSPNFFENLNDKNAYKSFGICQNCYQQVMVGIGKIQKDCSARLFNQLNYYVIPKNINTNLSYEKRLKWIKKTLSDKPDDYDQDLELVNKIKKRDLKVDFLFWRTDQASFIVLDSINDVYYNDLQEIFSELRDIRRNKFYSKLSRELKPKLNSIYWLLFPNYKSHSNPDPKLYRKELLNLLNSILKKREIDYSYLIDNFTFIFRKRYFKNKKDIIYQPLQMNILLSWFNRITDLKGGFNVAEGTSLTDVINDDIKEFFEVHADIYADNNYRQGLFILGKLMNEVLKEQQSENKSANILDKLSFDGLPVRRLRKFAKDITEILNIYDKYGVNQLLHAQMMDRLQGIENSNLNKDEVVFYILSGISFGRYLGHKYNQSN